MRRACHLLPLAAALGAFAAAPAVAQAIDFDINPQPAYTGEQITLTDTAPDPGMTDQWDVDNDGNVDQTGSQITVGQYSQTGDYLVTMFRGADQVSNEVVVTTTPHASFTFSPSEPNPGDQITFTSTSTPSKVKKTNWDLNGDGAFDDATGHSATATFPDAGQHTVSLQVSDGRTVDVATQTVTVASPSGPPPPPPGPTLSPSFGPTGEAPAAGKPAHFDASGSTSPDGTKIVSYLWDFNGDGHVDANTGALPGADFRFGHAGSHDVGMAIEDSTGAVSPFAHETVTVSAGPPGCLPEVDAGWLSLLGACIHQSGNTYTIDVGAGAELNGLNLTGNSGVQLIFTKGDHQWTLSSHGEVRAQLANTPAGTITLFRRDFGSHPIVLPVGAAHAGAGAPGLLLGSFPVAPSCPPPAPGPVPDLCAKLPGGFPITGEVALYLIAPDATHPPGLAVRGRASLSTPFTATGEFSIGADRDTGPRLDTLAFTVGGADLGFGRLDRIALSYTRLAADGSMDVWEGDASGFLRLPSSPGLSGHVRFANGRFGTASLRTSSRIALAPSLFIDSFTGALSTNPFLVSGSSSLTIGPGHITGSLRAEGTGTGSHIQVKGALTGFLGLPLPSATVDLYGNGGASVQATLEQHLVVGGLHLFDATGSLSGFFAPPPAGHARPPAMQLEGRSSFSVPGLAGTGDMLVNQNWIAACGSVHGPAGPSFSGGFQLRQPPRGLSDLILRIGSCDLGPLRATAAGAHAAAAGSYAFHVPAGTRGIELEVTGEGGVPRLHVSGPGGAALDTSEDAVVRQGSLLAVPNPDARATYVYLGKPRAGAWNLTILDGSPQIARVRTATQAAAVRVTGKVSGRGARRTLRYRIAAAPGDSVRFVEIGRSAHDLGAAHGKHGTLKFTPAPGGGKRRIVAVVERGGVTIAQLTVASYVAGTGGPGKVGKVRIRRSGGHATVTWKRARGATQYVVDVAGSDGRRVGYRVRGTSVRVPALPPAVSLRVNVRGADSAGRLGRARAARLSAAGRSG